MFYLAFQKSLKSWCKNKQGGYIVIVYPLIYVGIEKDSVNSKLYYHSFKTGKNVLDWKNVVDKNVYGGVVLMDLPKAFDTMNMSFS